MIKIIYGFWGMYRNFLWVLYIDILPLLSFNIVPKKLGKKIAPI